MNKSDRTARLHHLHELVLQQSIARQKNATDALREQTEVLFQLQNGIETADRDQVALSHTGYDTLLWHHYFDLLQDKKTKQADNVEGHNQEVEQYRQQTVLAYQDAKRWEIHHEHTLELIVSDRNKHDLRQADDLAASRNKTAL